MVVKSKSRKIPKTLTTVPQSARAGAKRALELAAFDDRKTIRRFLIDNKFESIWGEFSRLKLMPDANEKKFYVRLFLLIGSDALLTNHPLAGKHIEDSLSGYRDILQAAKRLAFQLKRHSALFQSDSSFQHPVFLSFLDAFLTQDARGVIEIDKLPERYSFPESAASLLKSDLEEQSNLLAHWTNRNIVAGNQALIRRRKEIGQHIGSRSKINFFAASLADLFGQYFKRGYYPLVAELTGAFFPESELIGENVRKLADLRKRKKQKREI